MLWPMILESIKKFGQLWVIILLGIYICWLKFDNNNLKLEVVENKAIINQLQAQSEAQAKSINKATKDAQVWHKKYIAKIDNLNNVVFPDDCPGAVKAMIEIAKQGPYTE